MIRCPIFSGSIGQYREELFLRGCVFCDIYLVRVGVKGIKGAMEKNRS